VYTRGFWFKRFYVVEFVWASSDWNLRRQVQLDNGVREINISCLDSEANGKAQAVSPGFIFQRAWAVLPRTSMGVLTR